MTPNQADLIRRSFDAIWAGPSQDRVTILPPLFQLAPDAQRLFPSDMDDVPAVLESISSDALLRNRDFLHDLFREICDLSKSRSNAQAF
jgi:hypothetical protein